MPAPQAFAEIAQTTERATELANQLLALAKVEHLQQTDAPIADWDTTLRQVALDLAPLMADRGIDFDISTTAAPIHSHDWALRELSRNLLHNAITHTPPQGRLSVTLRCDASHATLTVSDSGAGLSDAQRERLFQPFTSGSPQTGSGLGLAICHGIVASLGGQISLNNRVGAQGIEGLDAVVHLPISAN